MGSIIRLPGIMATAAIGGAALIMAAPAAAAQPAAAQPAAAQPAAAQPAAAALGRVSVPCSVPALDAAIGFANTHGGGTLQLAARCTYLITTPATVADGLPPISAPISLIGAPGTVLSRDPGAASFRILEVAAGGTLQVSNVTILNGHTTGVGGGILNAGTVIVTQDIFTGNTASSGAALANQASATANVSGSTFDGNTTSGVGGGAIINFARLRVAGSRFTGNTAPINGGALNTQPAGRSLLISSTFRHNTSGSLGGAISNLGTTTLIGTVVRQNQGSAGGGIATGNTKVTLRHSAVVNNKPGNCSPANTIAGCAN